MSQGPRRGEVVAETRGNAESCSSRKAGEEMRTFCPEKNSLVGPLESLLQREMMDSI